MRVREWVIGPQGSGPFGNINQCMEWAIGVLDFRQTTEEHIFDLWNVDLGLMCISAVSLAQTQRCR